MKTDMVEESRTKLETETKNLSLLKETVAKSSQLTSGMCNILTSFDEHLRTLEGRILPLYHETGNLQRQQENVEKTLDILNSVIKHYQVAKDVESIVRDGPNDRLDEYLASMEKLQESIAYFDNHNSSSPELVNAVSLFDIGGDAIQKEFKNLLLRHSKPIPSIAILEIISQDEELSSDDERSSITCLPADIQRELIKMAHWLNKSKRDDYTTIFSTVRSNILQRSMQNLKDHQKSSSGNSSVVNIHGSPSLGRRGKETPTQKTTKRIQHVFKKKKESIMKYSSDVIKGHKAPSHLSEAKDEISEQEIVAYLTCVTALFKLMQIEQHLIFEIIPEEHQSKVFGRVVQQTLENLMTEGESLTQRVKKAVGRHDFAAALSLFPLLQHLTSIKPDSDLQFEDSNSCVRIKIQSFIVILQTTINKALEEFVENIRYDPDTKVPKDGTVHELTSNVLILLEQLQDYQDSLGSVLTIHDLTHLSKTADSEEKNKLALAQYSKRVLTYLALSLRNKGENYSDSHLKAIFQLNNMQYILKFLQRTGLLEVVTTYYDDVEKLYYEQIREERKAYAQSWSNVLHFITETDRSTNFGRSATLTQGASLKLKDKDRQTIKDRFNGFNKEMEDLYRTQKAYAIPDIELRESLKRDNKENILPRYQAFYDRYLNVPFTKNTDKYLKYTVQDVSNMIDKFFDEAA